jgi:hypothetical protein
VRVASCLGGGLATGAACSTELPPGYPPEDAGLDGASSEGGSGDSSFEHAVTEGGAASTDGADAGTKETADASADAVPGDAGAAEASDDGTGSLVVTVDASVAGQMGCAAITSLVVAPTATTVGHAIGLQATGVDPQGQSSDVMLAWHAQGATGTFTTATGPSTSFTCDAPGAVMITVTASVADSGGPCGSSSSIVVDVTCRAP